MASLDAGHEPEQQNDDADQEPAAPEPDDVHPRGLEDLPLGLRPDLEQGDPFGLVGRRLYGPGVRFRRRLDGGVDLAVEAVQVALRDGLRDQADQDEEEERE
jgi:hypothetical protein